MISLSRRQLARYAVDEMLANHSTNALAERLAVAMLVTGRVKELELLLADLDRELEDRKLLARAKVTVAHQLTEKLQQEIAEHLKKLTGAEKIDLIPQLDKGVLGGIKIETANHVWDKTARRKLNDTKEVTRSG